MTIDSSMIQFKDRANADSSVYPISIQKAIVDKPDGDDLTTYITEYNISLHQRNTTAGVGTPRRDTSIFTLSEAIAQVPEEYKHGGLKLTFNSSNRNDSSTFDCVRSYRFDASSWADSSLNLKLWNEEGNNALVGYYTCTSNSNQNKVVNDASGYVLSLGGSMKIKFTNKNTLANPTLNINGQGAKAIVYDGSICSSTNTWNDGETVECYYDGSVYQLNNVAGGGNFATGQKVRETGIDSEPTAESKNLVESGGVEERLSNNIIVGKGQILSENFYEYFIPGHIYKLTLRNVNWDKTGVSAYTVFGIDWYDAQGIRTSIVTVTYPAVANSYYQFTIPSECTKIRICGRAAVDEKIRFSIQDVTDLDNLSKSAFFTGYYEMANLDSLKTKGAYIRKSSEGYASPIVLVSNNTDSNVISQLIIDNSLPYIKFRKCINDVWSSWQPLFLIVKGNFADNETLNNIILRGVYQREADTYDSGYGAIKALNVATKHDTVDVVLQSISEVNANFLHTMNRCRRSDSLDQSNNRIWNDWMYEKKDIGKLIGSIIKTKGSANADYTGIHLEAGKYYRFECHCGTSKFRIRAKVTSGNNTNQNLFDIDGSIVSNNRTNNWVYSGIHIFKLVGEDTHIIRIMDVQNDNPEIIEGLEINIYEANPIEIAVSKAFAQIGIEQLLYELCTQSSNTTFENVLLDAGRFYKIHVNGGCTITAYYNSNPVGLVDINGRTITSVTNGTYYICANSQVNKIVAANVASGESAVLRIYNQDTFINSNVSPFDDTFPEILPDYIAPLTSKRMYSYMNGLHVQNEDLKSTNAIYDFASGSISHDSTLVIQNEYAYAVFCYDGGPNAKDNASSPTAQVVLKWVNLSDVSDNGSVIIAQRDAVYATSSGTCTQTGGAGSPTMYNLNGILHILYAANVDDAYIQMHTTFNTSNSTVGTYDKWTLTDGVVSGVLNNTLLGQMFGTVRADNVFYQMQMNCTIGVNVETIEGVDTNVYYGGLVYGDANGNALILKTTDFVNWTFVSKFDFGCGGAYELAVWCRSGYLYACKRQSYPSTDAGNKVGAYSTDNETLSPLAKFNLSTKKWVASVAVKNCCTRMTFFEYDNKLYFVTSGPARKNAQFILIDDNKLANSKIVLEAEHSIFSYPSIYNSNGQLYIIGTESTAHIKLYAITLFAYNQNTVNTNFLGLMNN